MQPCSWETYRVPLAVAASRRSVLLGIAVAALAASCAEPNVDGSPGDAEPRPDPEFLILSRSLIGDDHLDAMTAARLSAAFGAIAPDVRAQFAKLARMRAADPQALLAAAASDDLKFAALAIVAAWYTGGLGGGAGALTVAGRDVSMQRPAADAMLPACRLGGSGWCKAPLRRVGTPSPPP